MKTRIRLSATIWMLLLVWFAVSAAQAGQKAANSGRVVLAHDYSQQDNVLLDISPDGRMILIEKRKLCPSQPAQPTFRVYCSVLDAYETGSAKQVGEFELDHLQFEPPRFGKNNQVFLLDKKTHSFSQWDPVSSDKFSRRMDVDESPTETMVVCSIGEEQFLGVSLRKLRPDWLYTLETLDATGHHELHQPLFHEHPLDMYSLTYAIRANCRSWKAGNSYLIPYRDDEYNSSVRGRRNHETSLTWVSTEPTLASRPCHSFNEDVYYGHAVSPDGSMIVVVTTDIDIFDSHNLRSRAPKPTAFLSVLDAKTCQTQRRWSIVFPDGEPSWGTQFATRMAISPDKKFVAISYGRFASPFIGSEKATAFFSLYSLKDGRWLATLRGDQNVGARWITLSGAPIGEMFFSPDSRFFFAGSWHARQWDVSSLAP